MINFILLIADWRSNLLPYSLRSCCLSVAILYTSIGMQPFKFPRLFNIHVADFQRNAGSNNCVYSHRNIYFANFRSTIFGVRGFLRSINLTFKAIQMTSSVHRHGSRWKVRRGPTSFRKQILHFISIYSERTV